MKKTQLYGYIYYFSANYDSIGVDDILNIYRCLMFKNNIR